MDNPLSWGILVILVIIGIVWFVGKCEEELSRNQKEQEKFWETWER